MACWVVAQKVPSSRVRGMYDAHLGAGDEWGKVDEYKMYLLLPCWLRCKRNQWLWSSLCSGSTVKQLKLLSLGFFLLAKLDWDEEWAERSLSVKLPEPSTHPIAPECKRERCWHPLQSLPLDCVRWHPVPSWVPAAIYCFVSPETAPVLVTPCLRER